MSVDVALEDEDSREYAFVPNSAAQAHAFWSWAPVVAYSGRLGSAKTRTGLEAAHYDCCRWPNNRVAFTRKIATDLFSSSLDIFLTEVVHPSMRDNWRASKQGGSVMEYPNGSLMRWFGLDRPGKALSAQYGSAYVEQAEELDRTEADALEGRLRLIRKPARLENGKLLPLRRRMVYLYNPDADTHWANVRFRFTDMQPTEDPDTWTYRKLLRSDVETKLQSGRVVPPGHLLAEVLLARPNDNVANLPDDYLMRLAQYAGPYHKRMVVGMWGSFEGQAFPNFRESVHVLDAPPAEWGWDEWGGYPPPTWKRFRTVDFGYTLQHAFVMGWFTRVPLTSARYPGAWVGYQEIYFTGRLVSQHARQAKEWDQAEVDTLNRVIERKNKETAAALEGKAPPGYVHSQMMAPLKRLRFALQVSDHDAEDRATLDSEGIFTDLAVKDRTSGHQVVYEALEPRPNPNTAGPDGKPLMEPGLVFLRRMNRGQVDPALKDDGQPVTGWQEFSGLRWERAGSNPDKPPKEDIIGIRDHFYTSTRYLLKTHKDCGEMEIVR